ncbi:protein Mpv17 [Echinococcus multilocularis]|uniref:Mitochondrial inner membrane protein Mpv17 n=1 Tax=Echinococcus multilocularis TaxID=6211 RepID=A0A068Y8H8_ECHMU|nr:protein Mpv17 [Echinococcus multilocularis]
MSKLVKLYHGYSNLLVKYPVRTQALSTAIIMGCGDIIAQKIVEKREWELSRTVKFGAIGLFVIGPTLNFWYAFLDRIYNGQSVIRTLKMVATDQVVMAPILCSSIIGLAAFTRNWSVEEAKQKLSTSFCSALKKNYMVWPPTQFINFTFVPVHFRLFVVNFVSLFWNSFLSYISQKKKVD